MYENLLTKSTWHTHKYYPKSKQLYRHVKERVKDLDESRMAQGTHHTAGHFSNLFLPATKRLLAVSLHKERVYLEKENH